jgi:hypothetical protein
MAKATRLVTDKGYPVKSDAVKRAIKLHEENPNLTYQALADATGRDKSTVWRALKRYHIEKKRTEVYKENRADILAGTQEKLIEIINTDKTKLDKASLKDIGIVFGILDDKERLTRGQSTQNIALSHIVEIVDRDLKQKKNAEKES